MAATDATGFAIDYAGGTGFQPVAYSAFGEVLDAAGQPGGSAPAGFPRYQYVGGFGYESDLLALPGANPNLAPITLQHLGWRWYDPATGRFAQRDPLGLGGAVNVYAYAPRPAQGLDAPGTTVIDIGTFSSAISFGGSVARIGIRSWLKRAAGVTPARPFVSLGVCMPFINATKVLPDLARIQLAAKIRQITVLNPDKDLDEALDEYEDLREAYF